jgi:putative transposase
MVAELVGIPEAAWQEAERRAQVVRPLLDADRRPRRLIQAAAATLGLSERQTYTLLRRCREAGGALTALLPATSSGGRGKPRLPLASEAALTRIIDEVYLTPQRLSPARVVLEVVGRCRAAELRPPSPSTIRRRLRQLPHAARRQRGEDQPETQPVHGPAPPVRFPLDLVQVDHTPVDLILVDPHDREPIGRPSLTIAIDVHSRCIAGFYLSLEAPSATSVGLCLSERKPMAAYRDAGGMGDGVACEVSE